jgi:hypothetical protein
VTDPAAALYLDLLKRTLTGMVYEDPPIPAAWHPGTQYNPAERAVGGDWPTRAHTMVGLARLDNLQECIEQVLADRVPGDLIETGVWRGGACIFMRGVLKAHGVTSRNVWIADSFQGFPQDTPRPADRSMATQADQVQLAVPEAEVRRNFGLYGLLDDQVRFLPGFFADTLPSAPVKQLAVLRLDGDLYASTMDALVPLYPRVEPGGYVIIDDYQISMCKDAVTDYRGEHGVTSPIWDIDGCGVFWRKE